MRLRTILSELASLGAALAGNLFVWLVVVLVLLRAIVGGRS